MPILRAMEAVTLQNLFLLFNSKGSSSKCCSSVGLCDTSLCSGWVFSVFRRMVTCSTRFFLTCQSIRTTIRLENSSWKMLLSITPASTVCVSFSRDWMSPMWCVTCHTNGRAAETIGIAILSWRSDAIHCSCFDIHLPHSHTDVLCRFGPCTP